MGPGPVFVVALLMAGATAITYTVFNFVYKIQKAKVESRDGGLADRLTRKINQLASANDKLKRRVEILESIVVDEDIEKLETGLDSTIEAAPKTQQQHTTTIEVNVDENFSL